MDTLKAEKRSMDVKAKKLRRDGYVIGNVIGRHIERSIPVQMNRIEAERILKSNGKGSRLILDVDGEKHNVLVKELNYNAMTRTIEEVDFQALIATEKVHSVAEIILENADNIKTGVLEQHLEEVAYMAFPSHIVDKITLDVGGLKAGDSILVKDLKIAGNPDIEIRTDPEAAIVTVSEVHVKAGDLEEETEEENA